MLVLVLSGCDPSLPAAVPEEYAHTLVDHVVVECTRVEVDGVVVSRETRSRSYDAASHVLADQDDGPDLDRLTDSRVDQSWDDAGNLVWKRWDRDADGAPNQIDHHTYDADGHETSYTITDGEGRVRDVFLYTWDEDGRRVGTAVDRNGDGIDERETTAFDDSGNEVVWARDGGGRYAADGVTDVLEIWTRDLDVVVGHFVDGDGSVPADGHFDSSELAILDEDGHPVLVEIDWNGDGVVDRRTESTWEGGLRTRYAVDADADGVSDSVSTYAWDDAGLLLVQEDDTDADGEIDLRTTNTWTDTGQPLTRRRERGGSVGRTTWTYADGYLVLVENHENDVLVARTAYGRDADGNVVSEDQDIDGDGQPDYHEAATFDASGRTLTWERDGELAPLWSADGRVDYRVRYVRDAAGAIVVEEEDGSFADGGADGTFETRTFHDCG